jgi:hypothetical protein
MKAMALLLALCVNAAFAGLPAPGEPGAPKDPRYCGEPRRDKHGTIIRSRAVLRRYVKVFPCPANLKPTVRCAGWALNHYVPLASGGCDSAANLTWVPDALKSCRGRVCIDRWERTYHAIPRRPVNLKGTP